MNRKKHPIMGSRGQRMLSLVTQMYCDERTQSRRLQNSTDPDEEAKNSNLLGEEKILNDSIQLPQLNFEIMEVDDDALLKAADETVTALQEHNYLVVPAECVESSLITTDRSTLLLENLPEEVQDTQEKICEGLLDLNQTVTHHEEQILQHIPDGNTENKTENSDCRKRCKKPNTSKWNRTVNKEKRKRGEEYVGIKKQGDKWQYDILKPAKEIKKHCDCAISKVSTKINCNLFMDYNRQELFNKFWKNMDWEQRRTHIQDMVDCECTKNLKNKQHDVSRRNSSLCYHLKLNGQRLRVCKTLFLNTYCITDWVVLNWIKKSGYMTDPDERVNCAKTKKRKSKKNEDKVSVLKEFLQSLAKVESHYCRKDSKKLYLEPIFQTKMQVYELYKEKCKELNKDFVSIKKFHEEFEDQNLSIYTPRKDQCDLCTSYKMGNVLEKTYENHLLKKELARNEKNNDNQSANHVLTVDKQAILLAPSLKASALYYKSKLVVHNYTVFNNKTKDVVCYVWHEGEGGVTSNEFASMLTYHIEHYLNPRPTETVIIWSDGCCYQNRNCNLTNSLLLLCGKKNISIEQKYLEHGHTQMECDSIHAQIEKKVRNREIYVPANYIEIMKSSRKNPRPYEVVYLDHSFFMDFSKSVVFSTIRPGMKAGDSTVTDLAALKYTPEKQVCYKLNFDDDWSLLRKRKTKVDAFEEPKRLYQESIKIKPHKYEHLQELKGVIPKDFHSFYDSLKC